MSRKTKDITNSVRSQEWWSFNSNRGSTLMQVLVRLLTKSISRALKRSLRVFSTI